MKGMAAIVGMMVLIAMLMLGCAEQEVIDIRGSDTMVQMVSNLAEEYATINPNANIVVSGGGSGTGIKALINGEVDVADASRPMKPSEEEQIREKYGTNPKVLIIARDMLAVVVHPSNPVDKLTMEELAKIFAGDITNWKEVNGKDAPITLYGRQSVSGTYEFFLEHVIERYTDKKEYSTLMRNLAGNIQIHDAVSNDVNGIGYIGVGYITENVKVVTVSEDGREYYSPLDKEAIQAGKYPLSRPLYQYLIHYPEKDSVLYDFLRFEVSEKGQEIVEESGFYPIFSVDKDFNERNFWNKIE